MTRAAAALVVTLAFAGSFAPQAPPAADAFAETRALSAELLSSRSATLTLERWCRDRHLAADARIVAVPLARAAKPATIEQRRRLEVGGDDELRYRHVALRCGSHVLSEADNWYVPARLTAEMNRLLDSTDTPFGKAVAALEPTRETFAVTMLWTDAAQPMPPALFEHRAVLYTKAHRPFSEVDEIYQRALVAE